MIKYFILFILMVTGGYYFFYSSSTPQPQIDIRKFTGNVVSIEGDKVTLSGIFVASSGENLPEEFLDRQEFSFRVDGATSFRKLETRLPSWDGFLASGATTTSYRIEDLPRVEGVGSLLDLQNSLNNGGASVEVDFMASNHNSQDPIASSVFYHILVRPPLPEALQINE